MEPWTLSVWEQWTLSVFRLWVPWGLRALPLLEQGVTLRSWVLE